MPRAPQPPVIAEEILAILRCPVTGSALRQEGESLICVHDDTLRYPIEHGVPRLLAPGPTHETPEETP